MYQAARATITLLQARRDEGLQFFESAARTPPIDFRREDSCCCSTFIDPFKMGDGRKCLQPAFGLVCSTSCNKTAWGTRDHVLWICGIFRQNPFDSEEYESRKEAELTVCKTTTMGSVCSAASREFGNNFLREPGRGGELGRVKPRGVKSSPGLGQVKPRGNVRQT